MKLIIAGTRTFDDYVLLTKKLDFYLSKTTEEVEVCFGGCRGADTLGKMYAEAHSYKVKDFTAEWEKYGKVAGFKRNIQMAEYATHCIVFWDGKSKGSAMMIDIAQRKGLNIRIVNCTTKKSINIWAFHLLHLQNSNRPSQPSSATVK